MAKWADYLISAVRYNARHTHIDQVRIHEDMGDNVGEGETYSRQAVVNALYEGTTFVTIFKNDQNSWNIGQKVQIIKVNGTDYIKTVDNGREEDNLENLPEF